MEKRYPTCSLIVSTYNWPEALELSLLSILHQKILPTEIIIADDGSTIETKNLIDKFRSKFPIPLKHVWHEDVGFRKTIILNEAIRSSNSEYIIQIDGDIIIHPLFIQEHLTNSKKGFFIRGSRTLINAKKTKKLIENKEYNIYFYSSGLVNRLNAFHSKFLYTIISINSKTASPMDVIGCNIAFWKDDFIEINGYNNAIVGWGREDGELAARLINNNIQKKKLKFMAICFHLHHHFHSRAKVKENSKILTDTIQNNIKWCDSGYSTTNPVQIWK